MTAINNILWLNGLIEWPLIEASLIETLFCTCIRKSNWLRACVCHFNKVVFFKYSHTAALSLQCTCTLRNFAMSKIFLWRLILVIIQQPINKFKSSGKGYFQLVILCYLKAFCHHWSGKVPSKVLSIYLYWIDCKNSPLSFVLLV